MSPTLISNVTDAVIDEVRSWQARPLEAVYPIVYLDALVVKILEEGTVQNRAVYVGDWHQHGRAQRSAGTVDDRQ